MSKEIKIKAWHKEYNSFLSMEEIRQNVCFIKGELITSTNVILIQSTGLKDGNNVEIYENDIVYAKDYTDAFKVVVWNDKELQWWLALNDKLSEPLRSPFADGHIAYKVIGNKYIKIKSC